MVCRPQQRRAAASRRAQPAAMGIQSADAGLGAVVSECTDRLAARRVCRMDEGWLLARTDQARRGSATRVCGGHRRTSSKTRCGHCVSIAVTTARGLLAAAADTLGGDESAREVELLL